MVLLADQRLHMRRWRATKKAIHTEIFINFRPVDSKASSSNLPILTLRRSGM